MAEMPLIENGRHGLLLIMGATTLIENGCYKLLMTTGATKVY
jgi:hypothetical protein